MGHSIKKFLGLAKLSQKTAFLTESSLKKPALWGASKIGADLKYKLCLIIHNFYLLHTESPTHENDGCYLKHCCSIPSDFDTHWE